jgi:hypothetical protein
MGRCGITEWCGGAYVAGVDTSLVSRVATLLAFTATLFYIL